MSVVQLSLSSRAVLEQMQEEEEEEEEDLAESQSALTDYDATATTGDTESYDALQQLELDVAAFIQSLGESEAAVGVGAMIDSQKLCAEVAETDARHASLLQEVDAFLLELNGSVS